MSTPVFINERLRDDRFEWVRRNLPDGPGGFTHNDLDSVPRIYTPSNPEGLFMLVEWKWNTARMKHSQLRTYGLMDRILRKGDPERQYYRGFYVVSWKGVLMGTNDYRLDPMAQGVTINGIYPLLYDDFRKFLLFQRPDILPVTFRGN